MSPKDWDETRTNMNPFLIHRLDFNRLFYALYI